MSRKEHHYPGRHGGVRWLVAPAACAVVALAATGAGAQESAREERPKRERDVGGRLIREVSEAADVDVMAQIMRLMSDVQRRLDVEFDPGEGTRAAQQEIVKRLNDAIRLAAKQRRPSRQPSPSGADRRSRPDQARSDGKERSRTRPQGQSSESAETASSAGDVASVDAKAGNMRETRRAWGNLPERDRDEVIQGSEEAHLERFRKWIERYYRALQETDE